MAKKSHQAFWLLSALILGAAFGIGLHPFASHPTLVGVVQYVIEPAGQAFLRLIFMIVVPMVVSGLIVGACQLGEGHGLGRVAAKTLGFTVLSSLASVLIGVFLVNAFAPGRQFQIPVELSSSSAAVEKIKANATAAKPVVQSLLEIIPKNPVDAATRALDGEMLSLMFFSLVFGIGLAILSHKDKREPILVKVLEQIYEVCMKIVHAVMRFAPAAVFCLVFGVTLKFGTGLLLSLLGYVAVVILALLIQQFGVYSLLLRSFTKRSPLAFFRSCREVYLYAFATASSNATLPRSLETAETQLKIPAPIARFVLTVGSTANQNGTALFEGITVLFLAQVYSLDLTLAQQVQVILMSVLAGVGTAGVPGGSLPLIMILLTQLGIPAEGMGLILGVDRLLDMCRTTVNVSGDLVIAALVSEKEA